MHWTRPKTRLSLYLEAVASLSSTFVSTFKQIYFLLNDLSYIQKDISKGMNI